MTLEQQARGALARGDFAAVATAAHTLVASRPQDSAGYFLLGLAAAETGQISQAATMLQAAVARGPCAEHLAQLARLLILLRRDGQAVEAACDALRLSPCDALTFDTIGCVFARVGRHESSIVPFEHAVAQEAGNLDYRYNLAAAYGFVGRTDAARGQYAMILSADPHNARAHYALAILSRQTADSNHVAQLEEALASASKPDDILRIRYALAKEQEDLGRYSEAFRNLSAANDAHKRAIGYHFSSDAAIFDAIEHIFRQKLPCAPAQERDGDAPVFVIGMPRTGTTLVDRILSSHPDLESAGELQAMPIAVKKLAGSPSRLVIDPETVIASARIPAADLGRAYLDRANHHRPGRKTRFIDKLPANFLYAGHIARALPGAKIICLRRNPMDTVWSNYKNLFASRSAYYAYSYDLMDIANYYARFDRLMKLWDDLHPGRILQLSYEALVHDPRRETRRLLDHCGLSWNDACLSFHENTSAVATPSAAQVRRPLNADAVERWRAHEGDLAGAQEWLRTRNLL